VQKWIMSLFFFQKNKKSLDMSFMSLMSLHVFACLYAAMSFYVFLLGEVEVCPETPAQASAI